MSQEEGPESKRKRDEGERGKARRLGVMRRRQARGPRSAARLTKAVMAMAMTVAATWLLLGRQIQGWRLGGRRRRWRWLDGGKTSWTVYNAFQVKVERIVRERWVERDGGNGTSVGKRIEKWHRHGQTKGYGREPRDQHLPGSKCLKAAEKMVGCETRGWSAVKEFDRTKEFDSDRPGSFLAARQCQFPARLNLPNLVMAVIEPWLSGSAQLVSQAEPGLVMSRFVSLAQLKMAQLGWLSRFELSHGNTTPTH
ncbi:hypothetical protein EDB86DRAFT_2840249 [Lactarius hatsudake]|nr:hypothetical protein EDB86DRAFT_2840249 [Lactarius hatsudake]